MDAIDRIRAFNRDYTARMGLLSRNYLGSGLSLTEVRVLYELARGAPVTARLLARALDIDEGYLSRVLAGFARKGWITRRVSRSDARRRELRLTAAGRAVCAPLDRKSRADIAQRLASLPPVAVDRAAAALGTAAQALAGDLPGIELRDLGIGDAGWLIQQHAELYAREAGFDATFEPLVAEILAGYLRHRDPACERAWVAARGDDRLGSIFCVRQDAETAKLRLFLVVPGARGQGLGKRLLRACIAYARDVGYRRMRLWTHESHRAACALYAVHGFTVTESRPVQAFGTDLVEQTWERAL